MRLGFMLYPETDRSGGVARWRCRGLKPLWWPDAETVLLGCSPEARAEVMLEDNGAEHRLGPGPVFIVDDVDVYRSDRAGLEWLMDPCSVPAGRYAVSRGPDGSPLRILDLTNDLGERRGLFLA